MHLELASAVIGMLTLQSPDLILLFGHLMVAMIGLLTEYIDWKSRMMEWA